jgi:hypothetical protein
MIYVEIDEEDFIDRMNKAHQFATHGFSHDGLKALFKHFTHVQNQIIITVGISCIKGFLIIIFLRLLFHLLTLTPFQLFVGFIISFLLYFLWVEYF